MSRAFFITSTGTGIGKTLVTAGLCHHLCLRGRGVLGLKPIISGFRSVNDAVDKASDTAIILQSQGADLTMENARRCSPWRFEAPLSPDMAAAREGKSIVLREVVEFCQEQLDKRVAYTLIEGAGGVMTPLNARETMRDWMGWLGIPVILVVGSYLGTISHTLTAVEALKARGIHLAAVIISESPQQPVPATETAETLLNHVRCPLAIMPRQAGASPAWEHTPSFIHLLEHNDG